MVLNSQKLLVITDTYERFIDQGFGKSKVFGSEEDLNDQRNYYGYL